MKKTNLIASVVAAAFALPAATAFAQFVPALEQLPAVPMISNHKVVLDNKELHGLRLANEWKKNPDKPRRGADGSVKYLFGATLPALVCTPLEVCTIKLQPGEIVNDIHASDTVRWKINPATEGFGENKTTLVVVKPTDAGLTSSLMISTDRRSYSIKLASTQKEWMPFLSFDYPDDMQREWAEFNQKQQQHVRSNTLPSGQNIANLDFNFKLSGANPSWRPVRVYTDGTKTYIQFSSSHFNEAPALVALGKRGDEQLVNYRLIGDRYIVDKVLDEAALIVGVGRGQTKVKIKRGGQ